MCLAVPGRIVRIDPAADAGGFAMALVDFDGVSRSVNLACTPEAVVGDYVLVHVGIAITVLDAAAAGQVFRYLEEIEALATAPGPDDRVGPP